MQDVTGPVITLNGPSTITLPIGGTYTEQNAVAADNCDGNRPVVIGGGPVLTANPEPLAPFFDAVLLGDGELLLPAFIDALQDCRTAPRAERLRRLAQVPGVYVPSLYGAGADGVTIEPLEPPA